MNRAAEKSGQKSKKKNTQGSTTKKPSGQVKKIRKKIYKLQEERRKQLDTHAHELEKEDSRKDMQASRVINWDLVSDVFDFARDLWEANNEPLDRAET